MSLFGTIIKLFEYVVKYIIIYSGKIIPFRIKCAVFCSFDGMYNDNPKPVSEHLHELLPSYPIYWAISDVCHEELPEYIRKVRPQSVLFWFLCTYANILIDNGLGMQTAFVAKGSLRSHVFKSAYYKSSRQLNVSTWHGTPLKKIGMNFCDFWPTGVKTETVFFTCSDYMLSGCVFTKDMLIDATYGQTPVRMYGTPRNDILFCGDVDVAALKEKLHLPKDKKVILFAPTWRPYSLELGGYEQLVTIDIPALLRIAAEKRGGYYVFVFRVHPIVLGKIKDSGILSQYEGVVADGNICDDMADYLACTDILITDYSSSMFDFALTDKPCFLYTPDIEQYKLRPGFDRDYDGLPFPKAYSPQELLDVVSAFDDAGYQVKRKAFLKELGNIEDGKATERVVKDIVRFIETGKK